MITDKVKNLIKSNVFSKVMYDDVICTLRKYFFPQTMQQGMIQDQSAIFVLFFHKDNCHEYLLNL